MEQPPSALLSSSWLHHTVPYAVLELHRSRGSGVPDDDALLLRVAWRVGTAPQLSADCESTRLGPRPWAKGRGAGECYVAREWHEASELFCSVRQELVSTRLGFRPFLASAPVGTFAARDSRLPESVRRLLEVLFQDARCALQREDALIGGVSPAQLDRAVSVLLRINDLLGTGQATPEAMHRLSAEFFAAFPQKPGATESILSERDVAKWLEPKAHGGLFARDGTEIPLESVAVRARIVDVAAEVTVFQQFNNLGDAPAEAKYVFPLDEKCAVTGFEAFINSKRVVGVVKEKEQAHKEYEEAVKRGDGAYLLDETPGNVFTIAIGNVPPRTKVVIKLSYVTEIELHMPHIIQEISSTTHSIAFKKSSTKGTVKWIEAEPPQTDFVLLVRVAGSSSKCNSEYIAAEDYRRLVDNFSIPSADGFILAYSITDIESFFALKELRERLGGDDADGKEVPCDRKKRKSTKAKAKATAKEMVAHAMQEPEASSVQQQLEQLEPPKPPQPLPDDTQLQRGSFEGYLPGAHTLCNKLDAGSVTAADLPAILEDSMLLQQQRLVIDNIECNCGRADEYMDSAVCEFRKAGKLQRRSRKKLAICCCCCVIVLLAIAVIALAIALPLVLGRK
eukprot:m51a1_g6450 putative C-tail anchored protein (622) ;mRNA; f:432585-438198